MESSAHYYYLLCAPDTRSAGGESPVGPVWCWRGKLQWVSKPSPGTHGHAAGCCGCGAVCQEELLGAAAFPTLLSGSFIPAATSPCETEPGAAGGAGDFRWVCLFISQCSELVLLKHPRNDGKCVLKFCDSACTNHQLKTP